jgi:hypothetical protein
MCYHSQGGFTHSEVYNMPVYLRTFYAQQLIKAKKEEEKQMKKAQGKGNSPHSANIPRK